MYRSAGVASSARLAGGQPTRGAQLVQLRARRAQVDRAAKRVVALAHERAQLGDLPARPVRARDAAELGLQAHRHARQHGARLLAHAHA